MRLTKLPDPKSSENVSTRSFVLPQRSAGPCSLTFGVRSAPLLLLMVGCGTEGAGGAEWAAPSSMMMEPTDSTAPNGATPSVPDVIAPGQTGGGVTPTSSTPEAPDPNAPPVTDPTTPSTTAPTDGPLAVDTSCESPSPGRSPLRRLTRFEYSNTVEALLGDTSQPGLNLPAELLGNGFGNDADNQPSSSFLIEQYANLAADLAARLTTSEIASRYDACIAAGPADEDACARSFITRFAEAAYRRPVQSVEVDELVTLQQALRAHGDFLSSVTGVAEAILQSPDFLYRVEFGADAAGARPLTGYEMASRLSYFFWGSPPDAQLLLAAANGELSSEDGVQTQAERLLEDPKARHVIEFFFNSYLPINNLTDQTRDKELFPTFSAQVGNLQHQEVQQLLMHEIFDGEGTWDSILTAPYTFVNEELASFYGISGVVGEEFVKVDIDTTKRLGLLTQAGVLTGTTVTNATNPVRRGGYLLSHVLCIDVPLPSEDLLAEIKPPEPYTGDTGRERYAAHSQDTRCAGCHAFLDPPGFALENFDAVGLWRDQENGVTIDASGNLPGIGEFSGPVELVQRIAENPDTHACFAQQWQKFAYGRRLDPQDKCNKQQLTSAFEESGHDVKQLLLAVTRTDGFRFLGTEETL